MELEGIWHGLKARIYQFIVENRPMFRDDGTDVGRGDIYDFIHCTLAKDERKITITPPFGFGDWPYYDYIVDDSWAATGLAEGTIINVYTGTKMYSTIQGAINDWSSTGAAKSIFVCPGTYTEDLTISATGGVQPLTLIGAGQDDVDVIGSITIDGQFSNYVAFSDRTESRIENIRFRLTGGVGTDGYLIFGQSATNGANTAQGIAFTNVNWEGSCNILSKRSTDAVTIDRMTFINCSWMGGWNDGGKVGLVTACVFHGCTMDDGWEWDGYSGTSTSSVGADTQFTDCYFKDETKIGNCSETTFKGCHFWGGVNTPCLNFAGASGGLYGPELSDIIIDGNNFVYLSRTSEWSFIKIGGSGQTIPSLTMENIVITNNTFGVPALSSGAAIHALWSTNVNMEYAHLPKVVFAHNALIVNSDGGRMEDYSPSTTVSGVFGHSVFGPNSPPNCVYDVRGENNTFYPSGTIPYSKDIVNSTYHTGCEDILYVKAHDLELPGADGAVWYRPFVVRFDNDTKYVAAGSVVLGPAWDGLGSAVTTVYVIEVDSAGSVAATLVAAWNSVGTAGRIPLGVVYKDAYAIGGDAHGTVVRLASNRSAVLSENTSSGHTHTNDHVAVTLSADVDAHLLSLTGQAIGIDDQSANTVFSGPSSGAATHPTFRALAVADIPFDDATSDPVACANAASDGNEGSPARKNHVHPTGLTVEESDGAPTVANVVKIKVSNGTLTDNGSGIVTVTTGGGGGGGHTIQDDDANMTARTNLSFQDGFVLADDAGGDQTEIDLSYGAAGYPVDVDVNVEADGTAITVARSDHKHHASTAAAGNIAPDDSAAEGSAYTLARSDHVHGITAAAASSIAGVQAAGEGDATSFARSNHAHGIAHSISDNALVTVDAADVADDEYARFTANGLESRSTAEVLSDIGAAPVAKGVTNGDSHDHVGGDGAQIDHGGLGGLTDDDHTQYLTRDIDSTPNADHQGNGIKAVFTAHDTQAFGDVCFINSDGEMALADADAIASSAVVAMCADASITANNPGNYLLLGIARDDAWAWTVGGFVYLSITGTTGNTLTQTAPTGASDCIVVIGVATHADRLYFNPQLVIVEHT